MTENENNNENIANENQGAAADTDGNTVENPPVGDVSENTKQACGPADRSVPPHASKKPKKLLVFSLILFLLSAAVLVFCNFSTPFAEAYANTVSAFLRGLFACITFALPFSLAETIVLVLPLVLIAAWIRAIVLRCFCHKRGRIALYVKRLLCALLVVVSVFINTFGVCYKRRSAADLFGLDTENLSEQDILITAAIVLETAQSHCDLLLYNADGGTQMPYGFPELCAATRQGYAEMLVSLPPVFSIKPVALSEPWTYTHISGMYFPFTGESNINVNFPDYVTAYTVCHETAHQLGIASEDEANFFAFLACIFSGDDYLRYAGCLNVFEYLSADIAAQSAANLLSSMDARIVGELKAYSAFFEKYRTSKAAVVASAANNAYLQSQGVSAGVRSYSEVTKLVTAYFKKNMPEYYR